LTLTQVYPFYSLFLCHFEPSTFDFNFIFDFPKGDFQSVFALLKIEKVNFSHLKYYSLVPCPW